jgi:cell division protein FtsL
MWNGWQENRLEDLQAIKEGSLRVWFLWMSALVIWLILSATVYVWLQVQRVNLGYRLAELQSGQEQLLSVQRKLNLELQHWQEPFRLEKIGREQFRLAPPRDNQRLVSR